MSYTGARADLETGAPVDLVFIQYALLYDCLLELRLPVLRLLLVCRHNERHRARVAPVLVTDRATVRTCTHTYEYEM